MRLSARGDVYATHSKNFKTCFYKNPGKNMLGSVILEEMLLCNFEAAVKQLIYQRFKLVEFSINFKLELKRWLFNTTWKTGNQITCFKQL